MRNKMRLALLLCVGCLFLALAGAAQKSGSDIPPFKLWQTGGRVIGPGALPKGKPVVLIYFAPDCSHCTTLIDGVFKQMAAFKKATLLLATFKPEGDLRTFERQYKTAAYPNIITGTEGNSFFFRYHYNIQRTPFVAFFDKQGRLVRTFGNEPKVQDLLPALKTL